MCNVCREVLRRPATLRGVGFRTDVTKSALGTVRPGLGGIGKAAPPTHSCQMIAYCSTPSTHPHHTANTVAKDCA